MHISVAYCVFAGVNLAVFPPAQEAPLPPVGSPARLQPGDAVARPLDPVDERSAAERAQLDALVWFGLGRLHEQRGQYREALAAYRRAIELNPEQPAIYRRLVPLEFSLRQNEQAIEHALKLVQLAPQDVNLMKKLSQVLIARGQIARAMSLLEKARQAESIDHHSPLFVAIQRDLGLLYLATGKTKEAAMAFVDLLDGLQHPEKYHLSQRQRQTLLGQAEATYERLGETFLTVGKTDFAIESFQAAAKARGSEESGTLLYDLARVYLAAKQPEKALAKLNDYIAAGHTDRGRAPYDLLHEVLVRVDREDKFLERIEEIAARNPHDQAAKLVLADELFARGKYDEARELYKAALTIQPSATGYLGLARVARKQGKSGDVLEKLARAAVAQATDAALAEEVTAIAQNGSLTEAILKKERGRAEQDPPASNFQSAFLAGKIAAEADRLEAADFFLRLAAEIRPDRKAKILERLALALLIAEKNDQAIAVLREALDAPADDGQRLSLLFRLAQALEFDHQTKEALATIDKAIEMAPQIPLLQFQRGWIHLHAGHLDKAEKALWEVIKKFPNSADVTRQARLALSALYVEKDDLERGEKVLEVVYKANPNDPAVCNDLGYLYADQGKKLEQAEEMIRKAVASEPDNPAYLDSLGWVLYQRGHYKKALIPLEKAVKQPLGDDATIWNHLGDVYRKLDHAEDAHRAWKQALQAAQEAYRPNKKIIQEIKEKLEQFEKKKSS